MLERGIDAALLRAAAAAAGHDDNALGDVRRQTAVGRNHCSVRCAPGDGILTLSRSLSVSWRLRHRDGFGSPLVTGQQLDGGVERLDARRRQHECRVRVLRAHRHSSDLRCHRRAGLRRESVGDHRRRCQQEHAKHDQHPHHWTGRRRPRFHRRVCSLHGRHLCHSSLAVRPRLVQGKIRLADGSMAATALMYPIQYTCYCTLLMRAHFVMMLSVCSVLGVGLIFYSGCFFISSIFFIVSSTAFVAHLPGLNQTLSGVGN